MKLYRIRHVIGRDNLHRIRITSVANGQNVGNSGEGHHDKQEAIENAGRCFRAYLEILGMPDFAISSAQTVFLSHLNDIPTVDERVQDPLEPQTQE